jgi:hypothetical protein
MIYINEWNAVPWDVPLPTDGKPLPRASQSADAITAKLQALTQDQPMALHFYRGDGLRWMRVAFGMEKVRQPADVVRVGQAIRSGLRPADEVLYFHALRSYDLLFFLDAGETSKKEMEIRHFGAPLEHVLKAWNMSATVT